MSETPSPESAAAIWARLQELAETIADDATRAEYLGTWRAAWEREVSAVPVIAPAEALHALVRAEDGECQFPESEIDSERRLIMVVREVLRLRAERKAITADIADVLKMAEAVGFIKKEIGAVVRDIESDLAHGAGVREEAEMVRVLYRRALGIRGPMTEAMLPPVVDARPRAVTAGAKRLATIDALLGAGEVRL